MKRVLVKIDTRFAQKKQFSCLSDNKSAEKLLGVFKS